MLFSESMRPRFTCRKIVYTDSHSLGEQTGWQQFSK